MLLAIVFPGISLFRNRRQALGILFLLLQLTGIGWVIGAVVAVRRLKQRRVRKYGYGYGHYGSGQSRGQWAGAMRL